MFAKDECTYSSLAYRQPRETNSLAGYTCMISGICLILIRKYYPQNCIVGITVNQTIRSRFIRDVQATVDTWPSQSLLCFSILYLLHPRDSGLPLFFTSHKCHSPHYHGPWLSVMPYLGESDVKLSHSSTICCSSPPYKYYPFKKYVEYSPGGLSRL